MSGEGLTKVVTLRNHFLSNLYSRSRCIYFCSKPAVIEAEAGNLGAPGAAFVLLDGGGKGAGGASSQQPGARDPWDEHDTWQSETRVPVTSGVGAASPDSAAGSALRSTTPAPGKRRAHSPVRHAMSPGGAAPAETITRSEITGLLAGLRASIAADIAVSTAATNRIGETVEAVVSKFAAETDQKLEVQGEQIQECRNRLDNTEHEQHELAKTVLNLQARMAAAEQALHIALSSDPNPPGIASKSWNREPDDTLLRISAANHMAKSEAERVFAAVLVHAKLAQGDGQPPVASLLIHAAFSKNYVFQLSGAAGLGFFMCQIYYTYVLRRIKNKNVYQVFKTCHKLS